MSRSSRVLGVIGELLLTAGVVVLLFLAWQLWWNDAISASAQSKAAAEASRELASASPEPAASPSESPSESPSPSAEPAAPVAPGEPPSLAPVAEGKAFGVIYAPRFGENSQRRIASGVGTDVLNSTRLGMGHYPGTAMPGAVGNFALAAHRSAYGGGLNKINELRIGDPIYVQTSQGWYTYRFRNLEYVRASAVSVLNAVPQRDTEAQGTRLITLTSCNPLFSTAERIIAYGVFESFQPSEAGPPAEIAADVAAWGN